MIPNEAKSALAGNQQLFGCWIQLFNPIVAEMMGLCGYDFLMIDMEHGLGSVQDAVNVMRAVRGTGAASFVRIPTNDPVIIKTLMDQGADGIMVPMVETVEQARAVVSACRYPPKGTRGLAIGVARGADYGMNATYVDDIDDHTLVICQIETVLGVKNAKAIAEVDGVDMLFIGRNDLAADAGHILDLDHPEVNALVDEVLAIAKAAGKKIGTVPSAGRPWQQLLDEGFDLTVASSDVSILRIYGQQEVESFKDYRGEQAQSGNVAKGY
jgi:4-hydroxy-2-oxoheptanedioate aldolase